MESRSREVSARGDKNIAIRIVPGHFATNHSHINFYVDMSGIKTRHKMAKRAGEQLARAYSMTSIDTIICLEGTEVIGAFLADYLTQSGHMDMNSGKEICVLTPELNSNNQMIFRDNIQSEVWNKHILLLIASASTGKTINRAVDCLNYYSGQLIGIAAVFSAVRSSNGIDVRSIFTEADLPSYETFIPAECEMCKQKQKIDAIVNSHGYSKL
ncbi:phosphoribosyltransferase [Ruminococcaceae bacterium OttesenSCG-928-L11]|nr:phosphoribosyltransferase [Ruminococcaceae bacterium OttesenSCG-928-L11]